LSPWGDKEGRRQGWRRRPAKAQDKREVASTGVKGYSLLENGGGRPTQPKGKERKHHRRKKKNRGQRNSKVEKGVAVSKKRKSRERRELHASFSGRRGSNTTTYEESRNRDPEKLGEERWMSDLTGKKNLTFREKGSLIRQRKNKPCHGRNLTPVKWQRKEGRAADGEKKVPSYPEEKEFFILRRESCVHLVAGEKRGWFNGKKKENDFFSLKKGPN